jgi:hypothetical protein
MAFTHSAYLAEGPGDPREELALQLLDATSAEKIVMYSPFERPGSRSWPPGFHFADRLSELEKKLVDLLPLIQNNVYHRALPAASHQARAESIGADRSTTTSTR